MLLREQYNPLIGIETRILPAGTRSQHHEAALHVFGVLGPTTFYLLQYYTELITLEHFIR